MVTSACMLIRSCLVATVFHTVFVWVRDNSERRVSTEAFATNRRKEEEWVGRRPGVERGAKDGKRVTESFYFYTCLAQEASRRSNVYLFLSKGRESFIVLWFANDSIRFYTRQQLRLMSVKHRSIEMLLLQCLRLDSGNQRLWPAVHSKISVENICLGGISLEVSSSTTTSS